MIWAIGYAVGIVLSALFWTNRKSYLRARSADNYHAFTQDPGGMFICSVVWPFTVAAWTLWCAFIGVVGALYWIGTAPGKWLARK